MTGLGAASGALWGGLIGLLFLQPLVGMAIGAAGGAAMGSVSDHGIDDDFMKQLGEKLQDGNAAVFVLVRQATADKVIPEISKFGGRVIQSWLLTGGRSSFRKRWTRAQRRRPSGGGRFTSRHRPPPLR